MTDTPYDPPIIWDDAAIAFPLREPKLPQLDQVAPPEEIDPVRGALRPATDA